MVLAYCRECAYVRNAAFEPELMVYDSTMDTNLHHSPMFQKFSADLVAHLTDRFALPGKRVLDIGCGQGEFLRELCAHAGCEGAGYDAMCAGVTGPVRRGLTRRARSTRGSPARVRRVHQPALVRALGRPVRVPGGRA